jgi:ATP-dependent protease ClpP protease subunit
VRSDKDPCNIEGVMGHETMCVTDVLDLNLLPKRLIVVNSDIDEFVSGKVTRMFQTLAQSRSEKDIRLLISSTGGQLDAGTAILRAIRFAQSKGIKVVGEVRGYAMSMAMFILQACDTRLAAPEDVIMVHGATYGKIGDLRNQEAEIALTKRVMSDWADFIATRNTAEDPKYHDPAHWYALLQDNFPVYLLGHEAKTHGLIDEVIL